MTLYIGNAFSLSMINPGDSIETVKLRQFQVVCEEGLVSVVGHQSTADLFSALLKKEIKMNRVSIHLNPGDEMIVGQYTGPRLEEGVTELPSGSSIEWIRVTVHNRTSRIQTISGAISSILYEEGRNDGYGIDQNAHEAVSIWWNIAKRAINDQEIDRLLELTKGWYQYGSR